MKAFLLAAGFGERLRPITEEIPKPLIPVSGIPSICYSLMLLKEAGIKDIVCNLHYKQEQVRDFFHKNKCFGFNVEFSYEEEILGTGGGLKQCERFFCDDDFIVLNSDIITDLKLRDVIDGFKNSDSPGTVVLHNSNNSNKTVSVMGKRIKDFKDFLKTGIKPEYDYMGIAVLSPLIFQYLGKGFSSIVYTGYTGLIKYHSLTFYEHRGIWEDVGTLESLERVNNLKSEDFALIKERVELTL